MTNAVRSCWPTAWLEAAVEAGFAFRDGATGGFVFYGGDTEREQLERFASAVAKNASDCAVEDFKLPQDRET